MRKETKQAFKELLKATRENLNNPDNWYIQHFMPGTGHYWTEEKDCDENGNWGFTNGSVHISEEDALYEAQNRLLKEKESLDEFLFEDDLREKMFVFMRALSKEIVK